MKQVLRVVAGPGLVIAFAVLILALWFGAARAQTWPQGVSDTTTTKTLSNVSGNCVNANPARKTFTIDNLMNTITIGFCETSAAAPGTPCTAAIGTAGTTTMVGGTLLSWVPAPLNQFCFIAASSTPSITIREGQ